MKHRNRIGASVSLLALMAQIIFPYSTLAQDSTPRKWDEVKAIYSQDAEKASRAIYWGEYGTAVRIAPGVPVAELESMMKSLPSRLVDSAEIVLMATSPTDGGALVTIMIVDGHRESAAIFAYDVASATTNPVARLEPQGTELLRLCNPDGSPLAQMDTEENYIEMQNGEKVTNEAICQAFVALGSGFTCFGLGFLPGGLLISIGCALGHAWLASNC